MRSQDGKCFAAARQQALQVERNGQEGIGEAHVEIVEPHADRVGDRFTDDAVGQQALLAVAKAEVIDPDMLFPIVDGRRQDLPVMVGQGDVGRLYVDAQPVSFRLEIGERHTGVEVGAVVRFGFVVLETGGQVDSRAVGHGVEREVVDDQRTGLEAVEVEVGAHQVAFREDTPLQVAQESVADTHQLGSDGSHGLVVAQADTDAAFARDEEVGREEVENGLQVERTQPQRTEVLGMRLALLQFLLLAQDLVQVVVHDQVIGLLEEVGDEDVAVVVGLGERRVEDQAVTFILEDGGEGDVAHVEDAAGQGGLEVADVCGAEEGTVRRLDDVSVERHAEGGAVALVEVKGAQVDVFEVKIDFVVVVLSLSAQTDVTVPRHLEVRVVADDVSLQVAVAQRAGGHDVVVIVLVEREVLDFQRLDIDRNLLARDGEVHVGLAGEGAERGVAEQAAQLQGRRGGRSFHAEARAGLAEETFDVRLAEGGCAEMAGGREIGQVAVGLGR